MSTSVKLFLDVTKAELWFPRRPQSWRVQNGVPSRIAVCSTKTVLEARRLLYLASNPRVGDSTISSKSNGLMDEEYDSKTFTRYQINSYDVILNSRGRFGK